MVSEAELMALRLLAQRPTITVMPDLVLSLLEKGLVERRAGSLMVTSRGHAALADESASPPPNAA